LARLKDSRDAERFAKIRNWSSEHHLIAKIRLKEGNR